MYHLNLLEEQRSSAQRVAQTNKQSYKSDRRFNEHRSPKERENIPRDENGYSIRGK